MNSTLIYLAGIFAALILSPLLPGIINKVKAFFAGRKGPSVFQLYYDMFKLLRKGSVYSTTTTFIFRYAPVVNLAALIVALLFLSRSTASSPFSFQGDLILFLYLCGLARVCTVLGAMDTGSSFEGMGASRECQFAVLSEGTILVIFCGMAYMYKTFSIASMAGAGQLLWNQHAIALVLFMFAFFLVILTESCRVPVDDPDTHLELTMIHEAMILDNSGQDLALIHYAAALKMWILFYLGGLFFLPPVNCAWFDLVRMILLTFLGSVLIGIIESVMARFRFKKLPQLLSGGLVGALLGMILLIIS